MELVVAVLAAGSGARFGGGKLDADCAGQPVGRWALDAVADAGLEPGVLVVGPDIPAFAKKAEGWDMLINPDPAAGLGASLALAAREAMMRQCSLLVLLADMPLIDPAHIAALARSEATSATRYPSGKPGVPALFAHADLARLIHLKGEGGGAKAMADMGQLTMLDAQPGTLADVDTAEGLAVVAKILLGRSKT